MCYRCIFGYAVTTTSSHRFEQERARANAAEEAQAQTEEGRLAAEARVRELARRDQEG